MSLHLESISKFLRRIRKGKNLTNGGRKLTFVMLASFFVMVSTPTEAKTPDAGMQIPDYTFSTGNAIPFVIAEKSIKIIPGESVIQKEERLKRESEEAARLAKVRRDTVSREYRVYSDPSNFDVIYQSAGETFDVDWTLLKAIHIVETGASGSTMRRNPSGATGPMQFLLSTFRRHAIDGNGDGVKDIGNLEDSIFTAAAYLRACGYPNVQKALWGYNPSTSYYYHVIRIAQSFGFGQ